MTCKQVLISIVFGLLSFFSQAEEKMNGVLPQLQGSAFVSGDFVQKRYLKGFSRALVSNGHFLYWQDEGVYWALQKPFFRAVTYKDSNTIHWDAKGHLKEVVKADLIQKLVSRVIRAMLSADLAQLKEQFYVEAQPLSEGWKIALRPKLDAVAQIIQRIDIMGVEYLQQIDLMAVNGDKTVITFDHTQASSAPSREQCQHFFVEANQGCQQL
jgi:hypothetical protein